MSENNVNIERDSYKWSLSPGDEIVLKEVLRIANKLEYNNLMCSLPPNRCKNDKCDRQLGFLDIITTAFKESDHGAEFFRKFLTGQIHSHHSPDEDGNIVRCSFCDMDQGYRLKYDSRKWCR